MKKILLAFITTVTFSMYVSAADYRIDDKGAHAFINFKIKHLGYSWLIGRFNTFTGTFSYDANNVNASTIQVDIDTNSIDSNHAKRDKHLRSADFLDTSKYGTATFVSTNVVDNGNNNLSVVGDLTLHGVTKSITINAEKIGEGDDPWGGYRVGFSGTTELRLRDFNIAERLGPASTTVQIELHIEGIRQ
ncbi:hypothetical protein AB835_13380 [Candidatus Endobugula sertula]|uniref:Lipid/polyisoprenoid-binding YceI-like domain-containing protein n=1 Tax=Candidatus Endobugula sertula TaxID=62101 RepID=A0A1D2QLZ6_9GAMM|nr:hypothetical protein AB835_13380 [Candidatus Endobugula sertula]